MDARSEATLHQVHPDLCRVLRAASQKPRGFILIHGIRTLAEEEEMVAGGHSSTLHSRHLPNKQGFACAVDFAALDNGHITWQSPPYKEAWLEIQATAQALKIPLEWGGYWKHPVDLGHVQLPWALYP